MPQVNALNGQQVVIKLIGATKSVLAAVWLTDEQGIWIRGAGDLLSPEMELFRRSGVQQPTFFVPWTSVLWVAVQTQQ